LRQESLITAPPRSLRLFLAIWPDAAVRAGIAEHADGWALPTGCLRYQPQDWHVTLHFIGGLAMERIGGLADAVDLPVEPFHLLLDKPQVWPRGIAVLGVTRVPAALAELQRRLGAALAGFGLPLEQRAYRPHVTLARRAAGAVAPRGGAPVAWPVQDFALVVSTGDMRRRYEVIARFPPSVPVRRK
jgi:2'-5' RNA ligase